MTNKGVSVIICCFNSAFRLPKTLQHIALQQTSISWEVIVVNNNSSDNTRQVAVAEWARMGVLIPFKVVDEPKPGLASARSKGIDTAQDEYLVFCDDDNWLAPNYVENVYELFEKDDNIGIIGGNGSPVTEIEPPFWFEKFIHGYGAFPQSDKSQFVGSVYGAGMAVRKKCYENQFESLLTGRKGASLSAGEDSEMCFQVRLAGYTIWYDERLKFKHFIPKNRLDWAYLKKLHIGFAKSSIILDLYEKVINEQKISTFYWLKKALYYLGIYIKYWPTQYKIYSKGVGSIEEIHHNNWSAIGFEYFRYNFKIVGFYKEINKLKI